MMVINPDAIEKEIADRVAAARKDEREKVLEQLDDVTKLEDFLEWVADRLEYVYHDNPRVDFIISLRKRADVARELRSKGGER